MRTSGQEYKDMVSGELRVFTCRGGDVPVGWRLWNGFDYAVQEWVTDGAVRSGAVDVDGTPDAVLVSSHQDGGPVSPLRAWLESLGAHFTPVV